MLYLIQGIYFQRTSLFSSENGMYHAMYAGTLFPDPESSTGELKGAMFDECGYAKLSEIVLTEDELRFSKHYLRRDYAIRYSFRFDAASRTWIGQYTAENVGNGIARCLLTEIKTDFFDPNPIIVALGKKNVHEWTPGTLERFVRDNGLSELLRQEEDEGEAEK